jgi:hypothetical protein
VAILLSFHCIAVSSIYESTVWSFICALQASYICIHVEHEQCLPSVRDIW